VNPPAGDVAIDTYVALDLEATGMDPSRHEIIEVAAVVFGRQGELERFDSLVRPRGRLSLDIAALTGIDPSALASAPTFGEIAPRLRRLLAGRPIVGQSVWMDVSMLDAAGIVLPNPSYDTFELATLLLPDIPVYTLAAIAAHLGVEPPLGHRALADAAATAAVFGAILERLDQLDASTLERLATYARIGEWSFADLFERLGQERWSGPLFAPLEPAAGTGGLHELAFLTPRDRPESLRRTSSREPIELRRVRAALAPGGALSRVVHGYEHRPQQVAMAVAVASALNDDGRLMVEAGTGTGKSVAYLLPAVLHATERGETVVVSTNTLALQDQLFRKDVPDLRRALAGNGHALHFETAVLKGRANYLCLRRWFALERQPLTDPAEARLRAKILVWLAHTETGDRAELRLSPEEEALWRHVAEEEDACIASRCVYQQRNQCFLYRARRAAEHAHLVIVNHALLLTDVMAGSRVLPEYEHLVVDEAHHLEDQATAQFGFAVDERAVAEHLDGVVRTEGALVAGTLPTVSAYLARVADGAAGKRRAEAAAERTRLSVGRSDAARTATTHLFARLNGLVTRDEGYGGGFDRSLRLTDGVRRDGAWLEVELLWEPLERELRELDDHLRWFVEALEAVPVDDNAEEPDVQHDELLIELGLAIRGGAELAVRLQSAIGSPDPETVYWIERSQFGDRATLYAAPLHVGGVLRDQLFASLRSVVLTSATITTDGTFDYVAERLGLEDTDELAVPSPFDYERSTLLYLADDIPEPNQPAYPRRLQETLVALCDATRGRALVLFTSHAALQATYKAIRGPLEEIGVLVLAQRTDGSPRQLVERLKTTPNVVVLGTATFWEGVDVVGSALSLLVITKLPFAVPSDPVFAARSELFEEPFLQYAVPQAVLKFKQGFGRLIRSSQDRGVCAVLDRRVLSKRYGASFVQSLPECSVTVGSTHDLPDAAADWLDGSGLRRPG